MTYPYHSNDPRYNMQPAGTVPVEVVQELAAAQGAAYQVSIQNHWLRQRLQDQASREEAYTTAFNAGQCTCTISESGRILEIMSCCLEGVTRFVFCGPVSRPDLYLLHFSGGHPEVRLDETAYLDDKHLLHSLQRAGVQVHIRRSTRTTAALIRQCVSQLLESSEIYYYAGWVIREAVPVFSAFPSFSSHQGAEPVEAASPVQSLSEVVETLAVQQVSAVFRTICSPERRWLVMTWYHAAFLFSLLEHGDASLPMGLCFFTEQSHVRLWLRCLFAWYHDHAINMDDRAEEVAGALWQRKDQPVLLVDAHQTANAAKNVQRIEETLASGKIFFRDGRAEKATPLRGAVTLITDVVSALTCSSSFVTIELGEEDFDSDACRKDCEGFPSNDDYLRTFAHYTVTHWSALRDSLHRGKTLAYSLVPDGTHNALTTMGTLLGVADFLEGFYCAYEADSPLPSLEGGLEEAVAARFRQQIDSAADMAVQFCYIARMCLEHQIFTLCDEGQDHTGEGKPAVYLIGEDYGFSRKAFGEICRRMGQSAPTVARSLAEAGLLRGKITNSTTVQTRIPVCSVYGETRWIGVYRLAQEEILTAGF